MNEQNCDTQQWWNHWCTTSVFHSCCSVMLNEWKTICVHQFFFQVSAFGQGRFRQMLVQSAETLWQVGGRLCEEVKVSLSECMFQIATHNRCGVYRCSFLRGPCCSAGMIFHQQQNDNNINNDNNYHLFVFGSWPCPDESLVTMLAIRES